MTLMVVWCPHCSADEQGQATEHLKKESSSQVEDLLADPFSHQWGEAAMLTFCSIAWDLLVRVLTLMVAFSSFDATELLTFVSHLSASVGVLPKQR
jgi:hypothetical protein